MPIDIECNLFEKLVFLILLYGCEIWVFHCVNMFEPIYRKFSKRILHLRPSTPSCIPYGEVGKLLLPVTIDKHMITYWIRSLNKDTSYAFIIYMITLKLCISGESKTQWLSRVKGILDNCGLSYIWLNQNRIDKNQCKSIIHKRIEDIYIYYRFIVRFPIGLDFLFIHNIHIPSPFTSIMDMFFVDLKFGHICFYIL